MQISISIKKQTLRKIRLLIKKTDWFKAAALLLVFLSVSSTLYYYFNDRIIAYGDAESHLNIAKRVVHGLTPGFAQLGGIWLPLPHVLMIPLVYFDFFWRSGLAGSIVSGAAYLAAGLFLYKLVFLMMRKPSASFLAVFVFAANPNILYLQSTPMSELPLTAFFMLSTYYFVKYIQRTSSLSSLLLAAFFGFCAVLSRYDGWFLVLFEAAIIILLYFQKKENFKKIEGRFILFSTLAFFGVFLWMMWDLLILGDPFYFTNSQFSARAQQQAWLAKGELPAYHNAPLSFLYYLITVMSNAGIIVFIIAMIGIFIFLKDKTMRLRYYLALILCVSFFFNAFTLFFGQSVIFIPHLTPVSFEWRLFNVRYGVLMIPVVAVFFAFVFFKYKSPAVRILLIFLLFLQFMLYIAGYSKIITLADGTEGLSSAKRPDSEVWMRKNYDGGLVLVDDYARTLSIIRSGIPMRNVIYVGTKPYWEVSLAAPERYARWIVMQKDDEVWKAIYDDPDTAGRLFKHFQKVYTSPETLIFRRSTE